MFQAVNDSVLSHAILSAKKRIVLLTPGIGKAVAAAIQARLVSGGGELKVTVVTDPDEDVVRIGYGDVDGLAMLDAIADGDRVELRSQPGLRLGALICDEQVIIWSPTPRAVEAAPESDELPNAVVLGAEVSNALVKSVAPGWSGTSRLEAELGRSDMHETEVEAHKGSLAANPPVDVQLQRLTRIFSNKLQFVEFKVKGARLSQSQMKVDQNLFNADVQEELRHLLRMNVKPFDELRDEPIDVPQFDEDGLPVLDVKGQQKKRQTTERELERRRHDLSRDLFFEIAGYGVLIEKEKVGIFEARVGALRHQLEAYSAGLAKLIEKQASEFAKEAADLVIRRLRSAGAKQLPARDELIEQLAESAKVRECTGAKVSVVYKDVTYQQTQSEDFRRLVDKALPSNVKKRLGPWTEQYTAAPATQRADRTELLDE